MAVQGPFKVNFDDVFPYGASARSVDSMRDFDRSTRDNEVQAKDPKTGELLWTVTVLDEDPDVDQRRALVRVKIAAPKAPTLPERVPGVVRMVTFDGLRVTPYVDAKGRQAYSLRADAVRPVGINQAEPARPTKAA